MSQNIEQTISNLIQSQFPSFYNEDGPTLIAFIQAYYEWLEQTGNPIYQARNLLSYADIDKTLEEFVVYFSNTYLKGIQYASLADKRLTVKKILDLYRSKGSVRALKLLFQLVFKEDIDVYFPEVDIFKPSDGIWNIPIYLEVSSSPRNKEYLGKTVRGVTSSASAVVDHIIRRNINGRYIDIFYLTNLSPEKDFMTGEQLDVNGDLTNVPVVVGSLSELTVEDGAYGFAIGDIVDLQSLYGLQGTAVVTAVEDVSGVVTFKLIDGGWGYSNTNAEVMISDTVLYLGNIKTTTATNSRSVPRFANVTINITSNSAANLYANAFAYGSTINLYATPITGTFTVGETVVSEDGNATGKITSRLTNTYSLLTLSSPTGTFEYNEVVYQANSTTANVAVGTVYALNATTVSVTTSNGTFVNTAPSANYQVFGVKSGAYSNVSVLPISITSLAISNVVDSYFASDQKIIGLTSNASANVLHFNTEIGVKNLAGVVNTSFNAVFANSIGSNVASATIIGFSSGTNANVGIGNINVTETVFDYTDQITNYLTLPLNSTTYGFPAYPFANSTTGYLNQILNLDILQVGEIENIIVVNPGQQYNHAPYVEFYQQGIATQLKQDYVLTVNSVSSAFLVGEEVTQSVSSPSIFELELTTAGTFQTGEIIYQVNSTPAGTFIANTANNILVSNSSVVDYTLTFAAGDKLVIGPDLRIVNNVINTSALYLATPPSANSDAINVSIAWATGLVLSVPQANIITFSNTSNSTTSWYTAKNVYGLSSQSNNAISALNTGANGTAIGKVLSANTTTLSVRRWSLNTDFSNNISDGKIIGTLSGANANIEYVTTNTTSLYAGDNANVQTKVITAGGSVANLKVVSSGFGYINAESITFTSNNNPVPGTAKVSLGKQGTGTGYYSTTRGFLDNNKYIQDGYYYQIFSYEVRSSYALDKYYKMVRDVVHVAGTELFGAVIKKSTLDSTLTITNSNTGPIVG